MSSTIAGVVALGLSGDGKLLAAGCADGVVRVWDLTTGKPTIELSGDAELNARLAALDWVVAAEGLEMSFQKQETARIEAKNKALDELLKKANETIATVRKELVEKQNALKQATDAKEAAQKAVAAVAGRLPRHRTASPIPRSRRQKDAQDKLTAAAAAESLALAAFKAPEIHLKDAEVEAKNYSASQSRNKSDLGRGQRRHGESEGRAGQGDGGCGRDQEAVAAQKLQPLACVLRRFARPLPPC